MSRLRHEPRFEPRGRAPGTEDPEAAVRRLIGTPLRVHLAGETGTGKNYLAYLFREAAAPDGRPFVEVNVANLPDDLFEAEFFGHRRGAFTGAAVDRAGLLESAREGTLFLNEVGDLSLAAQAKLLTVLDGGLYRRLGDSRERRFEARVISATSRDLQALMNSGEFRADLYYRLAQVTLTLTPLRQRRQIIPGLARRFLAAVAGQRGIRLFFDSAALDRLLDDPWPGNIRELRDCVETLAWLAPDDGHISGETVLALRGAPVEDAPADGPGEPTLHEMVERLERRAILQALIAAGGNKTRAARQLGLSLPGLRLKIRRLQLPE